MVFEAGTLRDQIEAAWSLSEELSKTFNEDTNQFPVEFTTDPKGVDLIGRKIILVKKENVISNKQIHQHFKLDEDTFKISVKNTMQGRDKATRDQAYTDIEDMCDEVERIIRTIYNPNTDTGVFFRTNFDWSNENKEDSQELKHTLTLYLWRIISDSTSVFSGYGGVLKFDVSESEGTGLPGSDFEYTEVYDVNVAGGIEMSEEPTGAQAGGENETIPDLFTGDFRGIATFSIMAKKGEIGTSGNHLIPKIGDILSSGELPKVVIFFQSKNTEGTPATLTQSMEGYLTRPADPISSVEDLIKFRLQMKLFKPVVLSVI